MPTQYSLMNVAITPVGKGVFNRPARIYRFPTADAALRSEWKELLLSSSKKSQKKTHLRPPPPDAQPHEKRRYLALSLLTPAEENPKHPALPGEEDLIGFVTTGSFNLGEGRASAIGSIAIERVLKQDHDDKNALCKLCIIRDSGETVGRLARWELV